MFQERRGGADDGTSLLLHPQHHRGRARGDCPFPPPPTSHTGEGGRRVRVVSVRGKSGTGKSTLIERLVRTLTGRGFRVAYLKHSHHAYDFGPEGKDTTRMLRAGAAKAVFAGEGMVVEVTPGTPPPLSDLISSMRGVDLVILEGGREEDLPAIVLDLPEGGGKRRASFIEEGEEISRAEGDEEIFQASLRFIIKEEKGGKDS
ncbi:MAG: molybdopterin-guanine dinucleotide biosynthesis protein B [Deltaproteobacteria bacterium]|nr:MAG: molybdopterin-guanine dinucleotide biosynthesis protein B [Deltaproteobacteria bacterium]